MWASEIEPFPIKVTKLRFPEMLPVGDITKLNGAELPPVDLVCGGSPCQDLSVANGNRLGLQGKRSGLFMEQIRVIKEMREHDAAAGRTADAVRPRYMVWENVPGAFSCSDGEDFRAVLEETCRIVDDAVSISRPPDGTWLAAGAVMGDQFSVAWRVLDAQHWPGTPQRRKRIYLVADFGGGTAPEILFEQDRLFGNSKAGEETRQGAAARVAGGAGTAGRDSTGEGRLTSRDEQTFIAQPSLPLAAGIVAKGNGDCFLTPGRHASLSAGGGQAGQGYPCVLVAGFSAGAGSSASGIGYHEECAPTLKASASGNMMPSILCLNDQGGKRIDLSENLSGTLRSQEHGHPPLVLKQPKLFENHGIDSRYTGPHDVAPTMSASYGSGGGNVPLVAQPEDSEPCPDESYCISGNIIDRQDQNGGNGIGVQADISYTVTATDRHCVFSQQRSNEYAQNEVVSTQSARQYKDATDLVCVSVIDGQDHADGTGCGNPPASSVKLIRRLTPLECERLQGYPDHWTDIDGACDSARYKALGNSVAIPCVEHVLRGIAFFLQK